MGCRHLWAGGWGLVRALGYWPRGGHSLIWPDWVSFTEQGRVLGSWILSMQFIMSVLNKVSGFGYKLHCMEDEKTWKMLQNIICDLHYLFITLYLHRFLTEKLIYYQPISLWTTYYLWLLFMKNQKPENLSVISVTVETHLPIDVQLALIFFVSFALKLINEHETPGHTIWCLLKKQKRWGLQL